MPFGKLLYALKQEKGKASDQVCLAGPQTTAWLAQKSSGKKKKAEWQLKQQIYSLCKGEEGLCRRESFSISVFLHIKAFV